MPDKHAVFLVNLLVQLFDLQVFNILLIRVFLKLFDLGLLLYPIVHKDRVLPAIFEPLFCFKVPRLAHLRIIFSRGLLVIIALSRDHFDDCSRFATLLRIITSDDLRVR